MHGKESRIDRTAHLGFTDGLLDTPAGDWWVGMTENLPLPFVQSQAGLYRIRGVYRFAYSFTQNGKLSGASDESGSTPI